MKKLIAFALIIITLALALASCAGENTPEATTYSYYTSKITPAATTATTAATTAPIATETEETTATTYATEPTETTAKDPEVPVTAFAPAGYIRFTADQETLETRSKILIFHMGEVAYYYSKADGEFYPFCFDPFCDHVNFDREKKVYTTKCIGRMITDPLCRHRFSDGCNSARFFNQGDTSNSVVYDENKNRVYLARGQKIYSMAFDASDLKLECSLGEGGDISELIYERYLIRNLQCVNGCLFFMYRDDQSGRDRVYQYDLTQRRLRALTSKDVWVMDFLVLEDYVFVKIMDSDDIIRFYTTDLDFTALDFCFDIGEFDVAETGVGVYNGEKLYSKSGDKIYEFDPLVKSKRILIEAYIVDVDNFTPVGDHTSLIDAFPFEGFAEYPEEMRKNKDDPYVPKDVIDVSKYDPENPADRDTIVKIIGYRNSEIGEDGMIYSYYYVYARPLKSSYVDDTVYIMQAYGSPSHPYYGQRRIEIGDEYLRLETDTSFYQTDGILPATKLFYLETFEKDVFGDSPRVYPDFGTDFSHLDVVFQIDDFEKYVYKEGRDDDIIEYMNENGIEPPVYDRKGYLVYFIKYFRIGKR